jgi:cytochrome b6-f complex iron-sulfur subunit
MYKDNIIVTQTNSGEFVALSKICTHEGASVQYRTNSDRFYCPSHSSNFTGSVMNGPATRALRKYATELNATVNTLHVFA